MLSVKMEEIVMRIRTLTAIRALVVGVVVVVTALYPGRIQAIGFEHIYTYYDTCGPNRVVVGQRDLDCDLNDTFWGVTTDFKAVTLISCSNGSSTTTYYECGIQVSSLDTCIC